MQREHALSAPSPIARARNRRLADGVIARLALFRHLPPQEIETLAGYAQLREFRRGAVIAERGAAMPGLVALASGSAKLALRRPDGEEKVLRILDAGESFGLAAVLLDRPCPVDLVALSGGAAVTVPPLPLLRLLEHDAGFAAVAARALAERMLEFIGELEASLQQSGLQRLARYLAQLAPQGAAACVVRLPVTKTTVAARLGVKKETLSRMLRELTERGVIAVSGAEISIFDREALARIPRHAGAA